MDQEWGRRGKVIYPPNSWNMQNERKKSDMKKQHFSSVYTQEMLMLSSIDGVSTEESSRKIYKKKILRTQGFSLSLLLPPSSPLPLFLERQSYSETLWRNSKSLKKFQVQEVSDGKCLERVSSQELPPSRRCSLRTDMQAPIIIPDCLGFRMISQSNRFI